MKELYTKLSVARNGFRCLSNFFTWHINKRVFKIVKEVNHKTLTLNANHYPNFIYPLKIIFLPSNGGKRRAKKEALLMIYLLLDFRESVTNIILQTITTNGYRNTWKEYIRLRMPWLFPYNNDLYYFLYRSG